MITAALDSFSQQISKVGFSLLFQAVIREDEQYLHEEEGEEGEEGEGMEEEAIESGAEEEDQEEGDGQEEQGADEEDDEESLGKRKVVVNGKGKSSEASHSASTPSNGKLTKEHHQKPAATKSGKQIKSA